MAYYENAGDRRGYAGDHTREHGRGMPQAQQYDQSHSPHMDIHTSAFRRTFTSQDHPVDQHALQSRYDPSHNQPRSAHNVGVVDPHSKWREAFDPGSGQTYYYHLDTKQTQWAMPPELRQNNPRASRLDVLMDDANIADDSKKVADLYQLVHLLCYGYVFAAPFVSGPVCAPAPIKYCSHYCQWVSEMIHSSDHSVHDLEVDNRGILSSRPCIVCGFGCIHIDISTNVSKIQSLI